MTDKQIIIDGVDVTGCEHCYVTYCDDIDANTALESISCRINCGNRDCKWSLCSENKYCEFKILNQFQYKTQECEKFRKANAEKNEFLQKLGISTTGEFHRINHYVDNLKTECEELKTELQTSKDDHAYAVELKKDIDSYRQSLEKIEEYIKGNLKFRCDRCTWKGTDGCEGEECLSSESRDILDIINEVLKDE